MTFPDQWGDQKAITNTHVTSNYGAVTAVLRDGWLVTTWRDSTTNSIKAQILNADGSAFGTVFDISAPGLAVVGAPSIAATPDGRFIVVYTTVDQAQNYTLVQETYDVFAGRIDTNAIAASKGYTGYSFSPCVGVFDDGTFYITYTDNSLGAVKFFRYANEAATSGYFESNTAIRNVGKIATSETHLANIQFNSQDKYAYLCIAKADGAVVARIPLINAQFEQYAQETLSVNALQNGNFVVAYRVEEVTNGHSVSKLKANIYSPQGAVIKILDLYAGENFSGISITPLNGSDFAFTIANNNLTNNKGVYAGVYQNNDISIQRVNSTGAINTMITTLNDGRFMVEWFDNSGSFSLTGQIFDPRKGAIDWQGSDVAQQYAGTKFDDHLHGGTGADTLFGGDGQDGLSGNGGNDRLFGGAGNDVLDGSDGGDHMDGGGWDLVTYLFMAADKGGVVLNMTTGQTGGAAAGDVLVDIESVQGTNLDDTITGLDRGNGNGVALYGMDGQDGLTGMEGGDLLYGGAGNDVLSGGRGADLLDGGDGWDVATYLYTPIDDGGIVLNMTTGGSGGVAAGDTLKDIEVVQGTDVADVIVGMVRDGGHGVELYGMGGKDALIGKAAADRLYGGDGDDVLTGGDGNDTLDGGANTDTVVFTGNRQTYTVTKNTDGTYTIVGQDGTDLVKDVEFARFDDQTLTLADMAGSRNPDILTFTDNTNAKTIGDDGVATVLGTLKAHDPDDTIDTLTFAIDASDPNLGKFAIVNGNQLSVNYGTLAVGTYIVKVKVSDAHGGSLVKDFTITSTHVNQVPVIDEVKAVNAGSAGTGNDTGKILVNENVEVIFAQVKAHDTDGGTIRYSLKTNPNNAFTINETSGHIRPASSTALEVTNDTDYTLVVTVSDGQGGTVDQNVLVKVKDVN
jgi:Ca2+-binding RTX toxin-like protein